jgi:ADP-ribose pyrophosphatase
MTGSEVPVEEVRDTHRQYVVRESTEHYAGPIAGIRTDEVVMPDGQVAARDVLHHPGAVGAIALDERGRVLVIQQYRHPVGRLLWEPPAGLLDKPGEPALSAMRRELYEEAHVQARDWRVLVDAFTTPGISDEAVRIFLARDVGRASGERYAGGHEEADMPVAWVPLGVLVGRILAGELHNPLLVMGVLALKTALETGTVDQLRPADAPWPERPF